MRIMTDDEIKRTCYRFCELDGLDPEAQIGTKPEMKFVGDGKHIDVNPGEFRMANPDEFDFVEVPIFRWEACQDEIRRANLIAVAMHEVAK